MFKIVGRMSVQVKAQDGRHLRADAEIGIPGMSDTNVTGSSHLKDNRRHALGESRGGGIRGAWLGASTARRILDESRRDCLRKMW